MVVEGSKEVLLVDVTELVEFALLLEVVVDAVVLELLRVHVVLVVVEEVCDVELEVEVKVDTLGMGTWHQPFQTDRKDKISMYIFIYTYDLSFAGLPFMPTIVRTCDGSVLCLDKGTSSTSKGHPEKCKH